MVLDVNALPVFGDYYADVVTWDDVLTWRDTINGRLRVLKTSLADAAGRF